jgi:hypothetical protein
MLSPTHYIVYLQWLFIFAISGLFPIKALALDKPESRVVLSLLGNVSQKNAGDTAEFDMKMLEKLPQQTFTVQTPWYKEPIKFTGPLLRDVLAAAGANGDKIQAAALNDYKTDLPLSDAKNYDVIVARLMNDKPMSIREKGPLFIVYPFHTNPELKTESYYNRCAWQLKSLRIY